MDEAGPSRRRRHQEGPSGLVDPTDPFLAPPSRGSKLPSRNASGTGLAAAREEDALSEYNDAVSDLDHPSGVAIPGAAAGQEEADVEAADFRYHSRSYDDEDAALQAALKASMADIPSGWVPPALEKKKPVQPKAQPKALPEVPPVRTDLAAPAQPDKPPTPRRKESGKSSGTPKSPTSAGVAGSKFREVIDEEDDKPAESLSPGQSYHLLCGRMVS